MNAARWTGRSTDPATFWGQLDDEARNELAELGIIGFLSGGRRRPEDNIHILLDGWAKTLTYTAAGESVILGWSGPGDIIGVQGIFRRDPHVAETEYLPGLSQLLAIEASRFHAVVRRSPVVNHAVMRALIGELEQAHGLQQLSGCDALTRVSGALANLAGHFDRRTSNRLEIPFPLSHIEICQYVGVSERTIARVFDLLMQEGIVRQGRGSRKIVLQLDELDRRFAGRMGARAFSGQLGR